MDHCYIKDLHETHNPWGDMSGFVHDYIPRLATPTPMPKLEQCSVAIVTVAIGKYMKFIPQLVYTGDRFFLSGCKRHYFVFTDDLKHKIGKLYNVELIAQVRLGFPLDSIMRFEMYLTLRERLLAFDYVYAIDSDCLFTNKIGGEALGDTVATLSAWYFGRPLVVWPFDAHPGSPFFVPSNRRRKYYAGGFYGGRVAQVLDMWECVVPLIRICLQNGYLPPWHDESIINYWFNAVHPPTVILGPNICYQNPDRLLAVTCTATLLQETCVYV